MACALDECIVGVFSATNFDTGDRDFHHYVFFDQAEAEAYMTTVTDAYVAPEGQRVEAAAWTYPAKLVMPLKTQ